MEFEKARVVQSRIEYIHEYKAKSLVVNNKTGTIDVFSILEEGDTAYVNYLAINEWENFKKYQYEYLFTQRLIKDRERKSVSESLDLKDKYLDEYKKRLANGGAIDTSDPTYGKLSTESVIRGQKFYQKNRDLSVLITAGLYILNIVEANVAAHLLQFNVNDDLSLKPDLQPNPYTFNQNVGFTLTYQF